MTHPRRSPAAATPPVRDVSPRRRSFFELAAWFIRRFRELLQLLLIFLIELILAAHLLLLLLALLWGHRPALVGRQVNHLPPVQVRHWSPHSEQPGPVRLLGDAPDAALFSEPAAGAELMP